MKKLLAAACALLLLAGCGGEPKTEFKTCSLEMSGMKMDIKMDAEDDVIQTINMDLNIPGTLLGGDASVLSDDDLKTMGDAMLTSLNVKEGEGISSEFSVNGKDLKAVVSFDLSKASTDVLSTLGISGNKENIKLSETVEQAEKSGATCK